MYGKRSMRYIRLMKKLLLAGIAVLFLATGTAHADAIEDANAANVEGQWEDCSSHNIPGRGTCVGRACTGNWPGPYDQCSPKAQSPRWLARTEAQSKRCARKHLRLEVTYKRIIHYN